MAECQLHRVGTAGPRAPDHQLQFQWTPDLHQTFSFVQRFRHSDSTDGRAEHAHQQHRVNLELTAIHRREDPQLGATTAADPGGVEGLLPLGRVQPQPTAVSLKLAWGRSPTRCNLYQTLSLPFSKPCMKPNKNLQSSKNP